MNNTQTEYTDIDNLKYEVLVLKKIIFALSKQMNIGSITQHGKALKLSLSNNDNLYIPIPNNNNKK